MFRISPDVATAWRFAVVVSCHASRQVAVSFAFHPPNINKVPRGKKNPSVSQFTLFQTCSLHENKVKENKPPHIEAGCMLCWCTSQTQLPLLLQRRHHMILECCRQPSEGSEEKADSTVKTVAQHNAKYSETWVKIRQSCHLAGGNSSVPLDHLLWLQNYLLIHKLSRTLHKGLNKNNNTQTLQNASFKLEKHDSTQVI